MNTYPLTLRRDKNFVRRMAQLYFTGLPRCARNDTAGAVKQNRAVREGCGKDASPQATQTQKTTSLRGMK